MVLVSRYSRLARPAANNVIYRRMGRLPRIQHRLISTLTDVGLSVLKTPDLKIKISLTQEFWATWKSSPSPEKIIGAVDLNDIPLYPGRPLKPTLVEFIPSQTKLGVSPSQYILHSLAHVELTAVDMYWDTLLRASALSSKLPSEFFSDFLSVAEDESRHLSMVLRRLDDIACPYGSLPAHKSLWQLGEITKDNMTARLALIPLVQEARGLDAGPRFADRLVGSGDSESAKIIEQIVAEEERHVRMGIKWFTYLCEQQRVDPGTHFRNLVLERVPSGLVPPFNQLARQAANFPASWYESCVVDRSTTSRVKATEQNTLPLGDTSTMQPSSSSPLHTNDSHTLSIVDTDQSSITYNEPSDSADRNLRRKRVLLVTPMFPEYKSSAAGVRTWDLATILHEDGHEVTVMSAATKPSPYQQQLEKEGILTTCCAPNDNEQLENILTHYRPHIVIFDRFYTEEMFSWKVKQVLPNAMLVLDTQDLHFLRHTREVEAKRRQNTGKVCYDVPFKASCAKTLRELASIHRCDRVLLVSEYERDLLRVKFGVASSKLQIVSFFYRVPRSDQLDKEQDGTPSSFSSYGDKSFSKRQHFVTIGNFHHKPNVDSVLWLKQQ